MIVRGFTRGADGILEWHGGRDYDDPGEAIKTWRAGELRLGCNQLVYGEHSFSPCGKPPKHDPDANGRMTKCGAHCAASTARREADFLRKQALRDAVAGLEPALRQIADGHNDPRALAQEVIARLDQARAKAEGRS